MKVAVDARELCGRATGVGRYLWHLLRAWSSLPEASAHRFTLYLPGPGTPPDLHGRLSSIALALDVRHVGEGRGTWWEQVRLASALRRDRPDVLFSPAYTAPIATAVPVVLTVHDLSFVVHPEWFAPVTRIRRRILAQISTRRARLVLTDAMVCRRELVDRLSVPDEKIRVIPLGVERPSGAATARAPARPADAPGLTDPMILFVGSIFNRRHLPELIRAVAAVRARHPAVRLEIVGDNRTYPPEDLAAIASGVNLADRVTIRSYVSEAELADLYASARVFAFLSDYEGFGLTPLEALDAGVPVVVGDTAVAHEVYGEAARYVRPTDVAEVGAALEQLLFDATARAAILDRAPGVVGRYSWQRAGRETLAALIEAARA